jgi:hypothetical protein
LGGAVTDLAAILAAFADGSCPQAVLADFLDDKGDERAERVRNIFVAEHRNATGCKWFICDSKDLRSIAVLYLTAEGAGVALRRHVLSWFPECYPIKAGDAITRVPGIGYCKIEIGEIASWIAKESPDEEGCFEAEHVTAYPGITRRTFLWVDGRLTHLAGEDIPANRFVSLNPDGTFRQAR